MPAEQIHIFGIRHHGPGCARSLRLALDQLQPQAIFLEGPADAQQVLSLANHPAMTPPVSLLIYPHDEPQRSVSFPLAKFSPEWQVLRWAGEHTIPVHLMDLPMTHRLALDRQAEQNPDAPSPQPQEPSKETQITRADPIAILAESAGYDDHELWWEEQIERRQDPTGLFAAILEAMTAIREEFPEQRGDDLLRESFMRKTIRKVRKEVLGPIAVVCGAWHAPVLTQAAINGKLNDCKIKDDNARLKGLPKLKTIATWIPWTSSRLSYRSGYGAGIDSPGWYQQVWETPEDAPLQWLTRAARLLRTQDLEASPASVVEASRLAETLAALRELRSPGLRELNEAIVTIYCQGNSTPLRLIKRHLEVGDDLGRVPEETPAVPLAQDLTRLQKSLRMKPSVQQKQLDLDLRKEMHLQRSYLLHRLNVLEIPWGKWLESGGGDSTFHELWELEWRPEFAVAVIEANVHGNTVEKAASNRLIEHGQQTAEIENLSRLLNQSLTAHLPQATSILLERTRSIAAIATDIKHLLDAVLPLAQIARYSNVRQVKGIHVESILHRLFDRIMIGLIPACSSLDQAAAESMLESIIKGQSGIQLLNQEELKTDWNLLLRKITESKLPGIIRGWATRSLLEQGKLPSSELEQLIGRELSKATPHSTGAAWLTGLLKGSGLLLIHQDHLWEQMDQWMQRIPTDQFMELLPSLRKAFSDFSGSERRQMGNKVRALSSIGADASRSESETFHDEIDLKRAALVLPVLDEILGRKG